MNHEIIKNIFTGIFTLFGSLIGSFSNVVILRMATATSVVFPPSSCPSCNHRLSAFDLIPVLSWLQLGGKCRYCKQPISYQYPLVEAIIATIVGLSFYKFGFTLNFILISSGSIIWFITSVIFLRNEVNKARPFMWASLYLLIFSLILPHSTLTEIQTILISLSLSVVIATLGSKRNKERYYSWGALAFLDSLRCFFILPYVLFSSLAIAIFKYLKPASTIPDKLFFAIQLVFIFIAILF